MKYIAIICPVCGYKQVGNWKSKMLSDFREHFDKEHRPEPYVKEEVKKKENRIAKKEKVKKFKELKKKSLATNK